jgi:hypothetical protein
MMRRAIVAVSLLLAASCNNAKNNMELCRKVYDALCVKADECGTYTYRQECITHYREECRVMKLFDGIDEPNADQTDACVTAIGDMDCDSELDPSTLSECRFLREPSDGGDGDGDVDADADADGDAEPDGDAESDGESD